MNGRGKSMHNPRSIVLEWAEQGSIAASDLPRALTLAGVMPSRNDWRNFLDRLLMSAGTALVAFGVIFFLAYNWNDLGRFAKLSLIEPLVVAALVVVWQVGLDCLSGKMALLGAALFHGALLALIGQTYQTGADTFELFGAWAAMILPWVLVGQFIPLWLLWLGLVNLGIGFYFQAFPGMVGVVFSTQRALWVLFMFNTVALAVWEACAARGLEWLSERWAPRLVATASGVFVTSLAVTNIWEVHHSSAWAVLVWLAWLAAVWAVYRSVIMDMFMLAGGVLSVIVVVAAFFGKHLSSGNALGFLLVGLMVIALSAAGGWWLKQVAGEVRGRVQ